MDGTRFDNMTRLFGSGTSRRTLLRGILGGAGAVAVTGATRSLVGAQECTARQDCINVRQNTCESDVCPVGSSPGNNRGTAGTCCTGNGTCCSNNCSDGVCVDSLPPCSEAGGTCELDADCCDGTYCCNGICVVNSACCSSDDCADCADCVGGTCVADGEYCPGTDSCYDPDRGGCCTSSDCDSCETCTADNICTAIPNCCVDNSDCDQCSACQNGTCVPYAEYCPATEECYNPSTGECCIDKECGDEVCIDGHCCPPGSEYCPDGDYCYNDRTGGCCTDEDCGDGHCVGGTCVECPSDEIWCETTQNCVNLSHQCCADSDCLACNTCGEDNQCTAYDCCDTNSDCDSDEVCCSGACVDESLGCCREFGDYCGVVEVSSAGGDDRQYDCCDGLLCCFGQSTNVCGECCGDFDCTAAPGGVCNGFQCEYPTCEGKWEACSSDDDCCHGLKCHGGVCKGPHRPHPKPPAPTPDKPVTTLPATGSGNGQNDSSAALGITIAAGAAALLGARVLRNHADEATEDA